jgi:hypothetical protein
VTYHFDCAPDITALQTISEKKETAGSGQKLPAVPILKGWFSRNRQTKNGKTNFFGEKLPTLLHM